MARIDLASRYRAYVDCLNRRDWTGLGRFVEPDVRHNGRNLGLDGYRRMLEDDVRRVPDLRFDVQLLVAGPAHVAARLWFDVSPKGMFLDLPVNGRKVAFAEHAFYAFRGERIHEVWSVIDRAAIEARLE